MVDEHVTTSVVRTAGSLMSPRYDRRAEVAVFDLFSSPSVVVVTPESVVEIDLRTVELEDGPLGEPPLFVRGSGLRPVHVDVHAGRVATAGGFAPRADPLVEVTGRFDPEQVRAAIRPRALGPLPGSVRDEMLSERRDALLAQLAQVSTDPDDLLDLFDVGIRLRAVPWSGDHPVGGSRFGGCPDLPVGEPWPSYGGLPMMFVGQFRTDELNAVLRASFSTDDGLVTVFVGLEADGGYPSGDDAVVMRVLPLRGLRRCEWPVELEPELRLDAALAVAEPVLTGPPYELDDDEQLLSMVAADAYPDGPRHQMFGTPTQIQPAPSAPSERFVLSFTEDSMMGGPALGDGGQLLVWASIDDGPVTDFGPCRVELDSG